MTPEARLWAAIGCKIKGDTCRVENATGSGMPDVNTCYKGIDTWIELKVMTGNQFSIRHAQVNWARKRIRDGGGRVKVLVGKKDNLGWSLYIYDFKELLKIQTVREDDKKVYYNFTDCVRHFLPARKYEPDDLNKCVYLL